MQNSLETMSDCQMYLKLITKVREKAAKLALASKLNSLFSIVIKRHRYRFDCKQRLLQR